MASIQEQAHQTLLTRIQTVTAATLKARNYDGDVRTDALILFDGEPECSSLALGVLDYVMVPVIEGYVFPDATTVDLDAKLDVLFRATYAAVLSDFNLGAVVFDCAPAKLTPTPGRAQYEGPCKGFQWELAVQFQTTEASPDVAA